VALENCHPFVRELLPSLWVHGATKMFWPRRLLDLHHGSALAAAPH